MKTLLACLIVAGIGAAIAYNINESNYGHYEAHFGPIDYEGKTTAANAMASLKKDWSEDVPKVELPDGNEYDFGIMQPEEEGEHTFTVVNVGVAPLTLKIGASTCKCTVGTLENESLAPGEKTEVKMSWTVKTNETTFGQSAELRTNDPTQVAIRFEITGKVVRQVQLVPETLTFKEVASGEPIELELKVYSYMSDEIELDQPKFSSDEMNELAEFEVTPLEIDDEEHAEATQAFLVKASIAPGLEQGSVSQNLVMPFHKVGAIADASANGESELNEDDESAESIVAAVTGRIVGVLSMLESTKLTGVSGGGYIYDFGKITEPGPQKAKAFVVLKGPERDKTKLSIGEVTPEGVVEAKLNDPIQNGSMSLYSLEFTLTPGDEKIDRLGMNREDYGLVTIVSDNPNVPSMKLRLKFSLPAR
ncbi:hypothetical protein RISK_004186 [Rhodopirellula islandica]|uniref:Signal peptide and transmembrane protein n=1 Tax=Rhodopirellula islandica TaxID=595434 RepID=A0A0J1EE28_RHOIS|nr:DUF1573 domain-containing protein [Rhodopirellula islandica]KLU03779.1 hypothetical protein RISK_004186 [Rhodopirellula islandica]